MFSSHGGHLTNAMYHHGEGGGGGGGLNAFYWYQIFAIDSAVVEVQEMFSSHGGHLTNAMYHHGEGGGGGLKCILLVSNLRHRFCCC